MKKLLISFVLVIFLGAEAPVANEIREERADFNISLLGIKIGYMILASKIRGDLYSATSLIGSTGVGNLFGKMQFKARIRGKIVDKIVIPSSYHLESTRKGESTTKKLEFNNGKVIQQEGNRQTDSGIDYLSGFFVVMRDTLEKDLCGFSYNIVDEEKVSEVIIGPPIQIKAGKYKCESQYVRKSGYSAKEMSKPDFQFELYYRPSPSEVNYFQLERMILHTEIGRMRVLRTN